MKNIFLFIITSSLFQFIFGCKKYQLMLYTCQVLVKFLVSNKIRIKIHTLHQVMNCIYHPTLLNHNVFHENSVVTGKDYLDAPFRLFSFSVFRSFSRFHLRMTSFQINASQKHSCIIPSHIFHTLHSITITITTTFCTVVCPLVIENRSPYGSIVSPGRVIQRQMLHDQVGVRQCAGWDPYFTHLTDKITCLIWNQILCSIM